MPFTPYHFGPAGTLALLTRKYIDLPVFVLANVIIDVEVLFAKGPMPHRFFHWHTFLVAFFIGALWGLFAYPLRPIFDAVYRFFRLKYETTLTKLLISGALGACFHVLIDAVDHYDVQPFWPFLNKNHLYNLISSSAILKICIAAWLSAFAIYFAILITQARRKKAETPATPEPVAK